MKFLNFKISTRLIIGIIAILVLVWVSTGGSYGLFGALTEGFKGRKAQKYQEKRKKDKEKRRKKFQEQAAKKAVPKKK